MKTPKILQRRARLCLAAAAAALALALPALVFAHDELMAVVTISPGPPRVDEPCQVTVRFETSFGQPVRLPAARVWVSGEMLGHVMPPVEAELLLSDGGGERTGTVSFNMSGEWRVTVRMEEPDDLMEASFDLRVGRGTDPTTEETAVFTVQMMEPPRPTAFSAWLVLLGAAALTAVGVGGAALVRYARSQRRAGLEGV
jgi:hypothetical protein